MPSADASWLIATARARFDRRVRRGSATVADAVAQKSMPQAVIAADDNAVQHRILTEQLALMCRLSASPLAGSVLIGAIVAYLASEDSGLLASVAWYAAALAIMAVRWRAAQVFLRHSYSYAQTRRWRTIFLLLIATFGGIWSIPGGFMLPTDPHKETIMSVMFIGATATGLGSLSPVRHAYAALLIPFTLPYGIHQFWLGGDRVLIGAAFLLYLPVMIVMANRQTDSLEHRVRLAIDNERLVHDLRLERDRANEANLAAQAQAAELRAANNDLEGFCYSVSHDLRAPLRAIDGFSHMLATCGSSDVTGESARYLQRIRSNVARMSTLIDDLLDFSRCGRQPLACEELVMDELALTAANEACAAHELRTRPEINVERLPRACGDRQLMLQVWVNLLDNAVKYSSKVSTPTIVVRGREEKDRVIYEVIDNGIGFDSRYSGILFGVFQRLHGSSEYEGTGVGLALVQRILTRHGGEVWADSQPGQGATFGFSLPRSFPAQVRKRAS